ncbi:MAG: hypothetical protein ACI9YL_001877 [Luteibaculaceae bacterium]|jgi:hypothetical protein
MKEFAFLVLLCLFSAALPAQYTQNATDKDPISDRPGMAFGATLTPVDISQFEVGHHHRQTNGTPNVIEDHYPSPRSNNGRNSTFTYRYGVNANLEMAAGVNMQSLYTSYTDKTPTEYSVKNFVSQAYLRGRYLLLQDKLLISKATLIGQLNLHRWKSLLSEHQLDTSTDFDLILATESRLGSRFVLGANLGIWRITGDNKDLIAVLKLDYGIRNNFHVFLETARREKNYMFGLFHDLGCYFLPHKNWQLDFAFSRGKLAPVFRERDVWLINAGISWRLGKNG